MYQIIKKTLPTARVELLKLLNGDDSDIETFTNLMLMIVEPDGSLVSDDT